MNGLCSRCQFDAAVPDGDVCASCLADVPAIEHTAEVIQLTHRRQECMFDTEWCRPWKRCGDCVEHATYGTDAA